MADNSLIEWCDATVNAINGCSLASPGCTNCYAMRLAGTRMKHHPSRAGLTQESKAGPVWTGEVRLNETALLDPLKWKRPRRIFWNAHGDTFHDAVPDAWIDRVFAVCALTPQHTHMILTKRSERMRQYVTGGGMINRKMAIWRAMYGEASTRVASEVLDGWYGGPSAAQWPLRNVWLGVSVEDQTRADERREDLRYTPAAIKFVSYEPALGPVDWSGWGFVDQIIGGGESGPKARPAHPQWFRGTRDWCADNGVAYFHKQNGEYASVSEVEGPGEHYQFPDGATVRRVGKKAAGRLLDGVEHNGMPEVRHG